MIEIAGSGRAGPGRGQVWMINWTFFTHLPSLTTSRATHPPSIRADTDMIYINNGENTYAPERISAGINLLGGPVMAQHPAETLPPLTLHQSSRIFHYRRRRCNHRLSCASFPRHTSDR